MINEILKSTCVCSGGLSHKRTAINTFRTRSPLRRVRLLIAQLVCLLLTVPLLIAPLPPPHFPPVPRVRRDGAAVRKALTAAAAMKGQRRDVDRMFATAAVTRGGSGMGIRPKLVASAAAAKAADDVLAEVLASLDGDEGEGEMKGGRQKRRMGEGERQGGRDA